MAVTRRLVAQDDSSENHVLKVDSAVRYIQNNGPEWQFLFNPNSDFSASTQLFKMSAEFDTQTFDNVRMVGYLYNTISGSIDAASSCQFKVYKVSNNSPTWNDELLLTTNGTVLSNGYYFSTLNLSSLSPANLDGDSTLMIEGTITRLGRTYKDRIYVNHLGVYSSIDALRKDVEFLDITKQDE